MATLMSKTGPTVHAGQFLGCLPLAQPSLQKNKLSMAICPLQLFILPCMPLTNNCWCVSELPAIRTCNQSMKSEMSEQFCFWPDIDIYMYVFIISYVHACSSIYQTTPVFKIIIKDATKYGSTLYYIVHCIFSVL